MKTGGNSSPSGRAAASTVAIIYCVALAAVIFSSIILGDAVDKAGMPSGALDLRSSGETKISDGRHSALEKLRREIPGVQMRFDPIPGWPNDTMAEGLTWCVIPLRNQNPCS